MRLRPVPRRHTFAALLMAMIALGACAERERWSPRPPPPAPPPEENATETLTALGVPFRPWVSAPRTLASGITCGVADGVVIKRGATGIRFSKPLRLRADFAVRLARFEKILQHEAQAVFKQRITRIDHLGTYVCRAIAGSRVASEHAYGNAIDVAGFTLANGRRITVLRDFARAGSAPTTPAAEFLARVTRRAQTERLFGAVLTPDFDRQHTNHLHLDGRPRLFWWRRFLGT